MLCYPSTSLHTTVPPWSVLCMCYTILHTYYHPYYYYILLLYLSLCSADDTLPMDGWSE